MTRLSMTDPAARENAPHGGPDRPVLSIVEALAPLVAMVVLFAVGATLTKPGTDLLLLVILGAAAVATWVAVRHGRSWNEVQQAAGQKLADALPAILILLAIGVLIGSWVLSGTIPYLVVLGLDLVQPEYLIVTAFLATAAMSLCTGTSWGSAGTIGVALMGLASVLDAPLAMVAGAVVSGAYFGDKMSPLSDSTNISAIGAGADLYAHIRHMTYTAGPSFLICLVVYASIELPVATTSSGKATILRADMERVFSLSEWALIPLLAILAGIAARVPAAIAMLGSALIALLLGVAWQGFSPSDALTAAVRGFDSAMVDATAIGAATLSEPFVTLTHRGGLYSMANTLLVIIAAFVLAGAMQASGALSRLVSALLSWARSTFRLIVATMVAGMLAIGLTSHGGVTALIIGSLFAKAFADRSLAAVNLSRSIEDSVTIVEPLLPWTVSALFMATTLGISTMDYAPWAFFCLGGPIFSLLIALNPGNWSVGLKPTMR